jgi:hypothetical protein
MHGRLNIYPPKWATPFSQYKAVIHANQHLMVLHNRLHNRMTSRLVEVAYLLFETRSQRLRASFDPKRASGRGKRLCGPGILECYEWVVLHWAGNRVHLGFYSAFWVLPVALGVEPERIGKLYRLPIYL